MFESIGIRLVNSCLNQKNTSLIAYGQTGSGKTYTVIGDYDANKRLLSNRGLVPRCIDHIFKHKTDDMDVWVSMFEIYNDNTNDLFQQGLTVDIKPDEEKDEIKWVNLREVKSEDANITINHILNGYARRKTSATKMNDTSSRSHCIITIKVGKGSLTFVDLAGSERVLRSGVTGVGKQEAGNINQTLTALGRVIRGIAAKDKHIPFRDCKLTSCLKVVLKRSERICFVATISNSMSNAIETYGTVVFAKNTKNIKQKITPIPVQITPQQLMIENGELKKEIETLRKRCSDLEKIEKELIEERDELKRKRPEIIAGSSFDVNKLKEQVDQYREEITNNKSEKLLRCEKSTLEKTLQRERHMNELLRKENEGLKEQNEILRKRNEELEQQNMEHVTVIQTYQMELEDKENQQISMENITRHFQHRLSEFNHPHKQITTTTDDDNINMDEE